MTVQPAKIAFYDLDGTLVSSNIVTRYAFLIRHLPSRIRAGLKTAKLAASVPAYLVLDHWSRQKFNEVFFREYRGLSRKWLSELSGELFDQVIRRSIYPEAQALLDRDRTRGFRLALITGELDFVLGPLVTYMGFDAVICNRLVFEGEIATGEVAKPLIAEQAKVQAMAQLCHEFHASLANCKGCSDSFSDSPMLEAVGNPTAVNPDRRLRKVAVKRGWPILDLRKSAHPKLGAGGQNHVHAS